VFLDSSIFSAWSRFDAVANLPYGPKRKEAWQRLNKEIASNNTLALASADLVFAVLDGVDVDSGTAAEIGYAPSAWQRGLWVTEAIFGSLATTKVQL
jgi:nucleoside 2-deoxyribosyltransferase